MILTEINKAVYQIYNNDKNNKKRGKNEDDEDDDLCYAL